MEEIYDSIIVAENSGFCFGVKKAVDLTIKCRKEKGQEVYTLGPLVHNDDVINYLKNLNIYPIDIQDVDKLDSKATVIIRSHGVAPELIVKIEKTGAKIINATCAFVLSIHKKVKKYFDLGYQIIIAGDNNHPEIDGINGWCNNTAVVTKDGSDLKNLSSKVCLVSQTTERLANYESALAEVKRLCEDVVAFNTLCTATTERQKSANEISKKVDAMVVIGSKRSSNSKKLFEICSSNCKKTIFIERSNDMPEWIFTDSDLMSIGVTAGASTPDWIINEVISQIRTKKSLQQLFI